MRDSSPWFIGLVTSVAVVGLLVGCAGGDAAAPSSTSTIVADETITAGTDRATTVAPAETDPPVTDPPETDPPVTDPPETDPPATDPPSTDPPAEDAGECLIGDWVVTEGEMDRYYAGLMGTFEAPLSIDATGSAPLSFAADGTYVWAPDFALTVEVAGQSGIGDVSGTATGNWTVADGVVTTSKDENALTLSISVNGVTFGGDDVVNGLLNSSPINGVTYSCDGPTPVLDFQTSDPAVTIPVTLAPA